MKSLFKIQSTQIVENPNPLYRQNIETGLRYSLNAFWHMIQNPVYCGRIFIPAMDGSSA
ncbi:hypothetical protein [Flavobacterium sp.]|uniref:hypothetical protein n=1 Tax=Flavobacterium sp. TaxID=239 RepID=UPI003264BD37